MIIDSSDESETHDDAVGRRSLAALVVGAACADRAKTLRVVKVSRRQVVYADLKE